MRAAADRRYITPSPRDVDVTLALVQAKRAYQPVDLTDQLVAQASDALDLAQQRYAMRLSR